MSSTDEYEEYLNTHTDEEIAQNRLRVKAMATDAFVFREFWYFRAD